MILLPATWSYISRREATRGLVGLPESNVYFQVTMEDAKGKKVPVHHVLVVVPTKKTYALAATRGAASSMAIPAAEMTEISVTLEEVRRAEKNRQELTYYQERGRLIQDKCRHHCAHILNKVDELYSEDKDPLPFICVEGSSGMGKSQFAYALEGRRPYFYRFATTLGAGSQSKGSTAILRRYLVRFVKW